MPLTGKGTASVAILRSMYYRVEEVSKKKMVWRLDASCRAFAGFRLSNRVRVGKGQADGHERPRQDRVKGRKW